MLLFLARGSQRSFVAVDIRILNLDEDRSPLQAYPAHQVEFEGEDLMKTQPAHSFS